MLVDYSSEIIIYTSFLFMVLFSWKDHKSFSTEVHQDYKSIIVSIGVLGTFAGIIIGLWHFDTTNIKDSVPLLLEGLKTAFITSIGGMFLSILLSAIQKSKGHGDIEDELSALNNINKHLSILADIKSDTSLLAMLNEIKTGTDQLEIMPLVNTKLDSIDTNIKSLSRDITSVKDEMRQNQSHLFEFLENSLNNVNQTLDEAINVLAKGATEEIIKALQNVIQDFNKNLTEQFGDNFKQLNEAVMNMIQWQENYKNQIEILEKSFKSSVETLSVTSETLTSMSDNYQKIDSTHNKLKTIIEANENQINNLESHLKHLGDVGEKAKAIVTSVESFSEKIKGSLSNQSETLTQLIKDSSAMKKEIEKQLPDSLNELNRALTSLTNKFKDDYNSFLQHLGRIMEMSSQI